ncbi:transducin family protein / WD-40 repeat family protein [Wolffia australiana]
MAAFSAPIAGPYLGEISALAFFNIPISSSSPFPLLLSGTGSQILVYEIQSSKLLTSFFAFNGVRVHGLAVPTNPSCSSDVLISAFGERRVKILRVVFEEDGGEISVGMEVFYELPRFEHWVLDALFLEEGKVLAIGLSDNSVAVWDIVHSEILFHVKSSEKCLLYSMRLWGRNMEELRIASGTIFNEIIVWKFGASGGHSKGNTSFLNISGGREVHTINMGTLIGHNGSIFRISWSDDGSKLLSASDDRSARVWLIDSERLHQSSSSKFPEDQVSAGISLYGHNARIWDCFISDSVIITAGEDCTCRLWDLEGSQILMFKEHAGRGIWRCLYDPATSLLVTAGFDSAIQVHRVPNLSGDRSEANEMLTEFDECTENFSFSIPNVSKKPELMDSKSEYVRCLHFGREDILFVATNKGYLYCAKFSCADDVIWTQLANVGEIPVVCTDFMDVQPSDELMVSGSMIALGDGNGNATIINVASADSSPEVLISFSWPAEKERQLLGIYWCRSLGCSCVFTTDPRGSLKLWKLEYAQRTTVSLVASYSTSFGKRIMCLDASMEDEILVCGDQRGNLTVFHLLKSMSQSNSGSSERRVPPLSQFKGAHGISSVTSVCIGRQNSDEIEIRSTGGDGCICYFKFSVSTKSMEFCGMKHVKELTIIKNVLNKPSSSEDLGEGHLVVGFAFTDFFIWNRLGDSKILQVPCGGWRRPYSYYLGHSPETQNCFAFLKDNKLHICRRWETGSLRKSFPKTLNLQFHGREIHTTCFISRPMSSKDKRKDLWVASGSEDGAVRLTRYTLADMNFWPDSFSLGEHVGGSAVRSLCFVPNIFSCGFEAMGNDANVDNLSLDLEKNWGMLISVGAKQVLTSWLLRDDETCNMDETCLELSAAKGHQSVSFRWLSTHIPPKTRGCKVDSCTALSKSKFYGSLSEDANDWRYLAVTAFVVEDVATRSLVCFSVVACSDATLTLRALLLSHRLWFDVASLVPQTAPVLALQHMVVPLPANDCCDNSKRKAHIVISGSTDGSITLWDLTETVEHFMEFMQDLQPGKLSANQSRPRTGRGSQGGRWWRSSDPINPKNRPDEAGIIDDFQSQPQDDDHCVVAPLGVLASVHQSGVNCLHVTEATRQAKELTFCIISGGDDQAISCSLLCLSPETSTAEINRWQTVGSLVNGSKLWALRRSKVESAHSAAVKGIWSDMTWVFSTGLDQRIRFWRISACGQLVEETHLIISVPEPESLDALPPNRLGDSYWIVVAGRGMQMIEFGPSDRDQMVLFERVLSA